MKTEELPEAVAVAYEEAHGHAGGNGHGKGDGNGESNVDGHVAEASVGDAPLPLAHPSPHDPLHSEEQRVPREGQGKGVSGLKGILEAILFVSGEPLSMDRILGVLEGVDRAELMSALRALQADYAVEGRGLQLVEVAGGLQITTRPDCAPWIKRLERAREGAKLSRSAMETLAIVAYKQPVVRGDIEQIRGVDSAAVLKTLLDRRLVRIVGRKDAPGRPIMYGTTRQFLQAFGLKDLSDLPALRDIKELKEAEPFTLANPDADADANSEEGRDSTAEAESMGV
jgi:segregation and condensation protein B